MYGYQDEVCDSGFSFGTSPPNRPFVADSSDLFRAVMENYKQDSDSRLTSATVDNVMSKKNDRVSSRDVDVTSTSTMSNKYLCKRCLSDSALCRCHQGRGKGSIQRVQWVDEIYDKPLAITTSISDISVDGRSSPSSQNNDFVKPILKHKANCIIIVSK